ncbi:MAG: HEPN domain-containing protein [Armatimonadota bacterium]|nr:HEPN domain-containing protein [bacterium]MDW8319752.1 HEPN domain-containing protein [Armatimonadota bacterium]
MERSADWMDQARGDLRHAQNDLQDGFYDWACFSAQQAAEKAVKAVFKRHKLEVWGHSIVDLLSALPAHIAVPDELYDMAMELDKGYISTRYPDALPSGSPRTRYSQQEAERFIRYARAILEFCEGLLA